MSECECDGFENETKAIYCEREDEKRVRCGSVCYTDTHNQENGLGTNTQERKDEDRHEFTFLIDVQKKGPRSGSLK